jgi:tetratricopeptide (TPR) repeat protein
LARPSPNLAAAIWLLVILNAALGVYSAYFGVQFMRASMWNNDGVALLGDGTREGRVTLLNRLVKNKRATLADPSLSLGDRRSLERGVASLEDEFEETRQKTVQDFRSAVEICPNMVTSWYKLASVYSMGVRANPTEADLRNSLAAYQNIEKYWPDYSQTPFNVGSLYLAIGEPEKALPYLKRAASMTIEPDINGVYIKTLLDLAQEKEARPRGASGEIVLYGSPAVDTTEKLKEEALRTAVGVVEKWDKAVGHAIPIGPADRSVPRLPPVVEIGHTVRISKADRDKALLDAANLYATTARAVGRKDAYLQALLRVHQQTPGDDSVISEIVSIYKEQGEYDSLQRFLEQILEDNPLNPKARFWLGAVLVEMGKLREAKRQAMILERISPSLPETKYLFFLVYGSADNIPKAKQFAEEYLKVCEIPARKEAIQRFLQAHSQTPPPNPAPPPAGNSGTKK